MRAVPPRPHHRRRQHLTKRQVIVLTVGAFVASAGSIVAYGISTGDQPDMTCTGTGRIHAAVCYTTTSTAGGG